MLSFFELLDTQDEKDKLLLLYECFENQLYLTAYSKTKDKQKAEDMVQDTFVTMTKYLDKISEESYESLEKYQKIKKKRRTLTWKEYADKTKDVHGGKAKAYLEAVLKTHISQFYREENKIDTAQMDDNTEDMFVSPRELPENELMKKEYETLLIELLIGMKYPYKEVLYLKYYNDLSAREIGDVLGKSEENVRQIARRGCKMLEIELRKKGYHGSRN